MKQQQVRQLQSQNSRQENSSS